MLINIYVHLFNIYADAHGDDATNLLVILKIVVCRFKLQQTVFVFCAAP